MLTVSRYSKVPRYVSFGNMLEHLHVFGLSEKQTHVHSRPAHKLAMSVCVQRCETLALQQDSNAGAPRYYRVHYATSAIVSIVTPALASFSDKALRITRSALRFG